MKRAAFSTVRDPENRSKKSCVCGAHSQKAKKKRKPRHRPEEKQNSGFMYEGTEEWSCKYFDGIMCEPYHLTKEQLTSCRGIYHNCVKQEVRNRRHKNKDA